VKKQRTIIAILIILNLITISFVGFIKVQQIQVSKVIYTPQEIAQAREYFYTGFTPSPAKSQQVADIKALYGKLNITYKSLSGYGRAYPIFRKIYLDYDIPLNRFARCLAHEAEHLKFEYREFIVDYRAIITLWESRIPYLRYQSYIGVIDAFENRLSDLYNCTNLLVEYYLERS